MHLVTVDEKSPNGNKQSCRKLCSPVLGVLLYLDSRVLQIFTDDSGKTKLSLCCYTSWHSPLNVDGSAL